MNLQYFFIDCVTFSCKIIKELTTTYEIEKIEQKKTLLQKEHQLTSTRIVAISSTLGLTLLLTFVGGFGFATKKKKEIRLLKQDKVIADSKKMIYWTKLKVKWQVCELI